MHSVSFSGSEVTVAGRTWRVTYPVAQAVLAGDRVLVLYQGAVVDQVEGQRLDEETIVQATLGGHASTPAGQAA